MNDARERCDAIEMGEYEERPDVHRCSVSAMERATLIAAMELSAPERRMKSEAAVHAAEALKSAGAEDFY